jgi:hypothetical protein
MRLDGWLEAGNRALETVTLGEKLSREGIVV